MAFDAGNPDCTGGYSRDIYNALISDPRNGFAQPMSPAAEGMIKAICYAVATALESQIQNLTVTVTGVTAGGATVFGTVA